MPSFCTPCGEYGCSVELPQHLEPPGADYTRRVSVDACLAAEVLWLWRQGVVTIASCCGHGGDHLGDIIVDDADGGRMRELGYEGKANPCGVMCWSHKTPAHTGAK